MDWIDASLRVNREDPGANESVVGPGQRIDFRRAQEPVSSAAGQQASGLCFGDRDSR